MTQNRITIVAGGGIDPPTLGGVSADETVTIANQSGALATITYLAETNPFSDIQGNESEPVADGAETVHTISSEFNPVRTYQLWLELEGHDLETSPKIRITGTEEE